MLDLSLFDKYKNIKVEPLPVLFEPDFRDATKGYCPFCHCKLYEMRDRPFYYCRSKAHKKRFVISKEKVKDVL